MPFRHSHWRRERRREMERLRRRPRPRPSTKWTWVRNDTGHVTCVPGEDHQDLYPLWVAAEASPFHDEALMEATKKINEVLESAAGKSPDPEAELCFIRIEHRPFLVWSRTR